MTKRNTIDTIIKKPSESTNPDEEFESFINNCARCQTEEDKALLRKAYKVAAEVHKGRFMHSGEPYIIHSLRVAQITTNKIGLGVRSAAAALLHEVITNSAYKEEDIRDLFDDKIAYLVSGLTKIPESSAHKTSIQAENFRKLLMTLSDDIRVIFIKLADRLHNMRIIKTLPRSWQLRLAGETLTMYAPLAHRLGMHSLKTELEDIAFETTHPQKYQEIKEKIKLNEKRLNHLINKFTIAISYQLKRNGIDFQASGRTKSIYSLWNKMQKKNVDFEQIYDLLAVRIIFKPKRNVAEDRMCWDIYRLITRDYPPKKDRIRDWVSHPKENGYEALHVTVLGPENRWIEVQIRSERMNEIAELGYAAHWKYKGLDSKISGLDRWIKRTKGILENPDPANLHLLDEFKLNVFASEILIFTPKGDIKTLPKGSTVLDFAFSIHSELGFHCIGGQIGEKIVPVNFSLQSGDKVKILTSNKARPKKEWLNYLHTSYGRAKLLNYFKKTQVSNTERGKEIFQKHLENAGIQPNSVLFKEIFNKLKVPDKQALYAKIGKGEISEDHLKEALKQTSRKKLVKYWQVETEEQDNQEISPHSIMQQDKKLNGHNTTYKVASCCHPIPGDDIIGFRIPDNRIEVHKAECPEALKLSATHADRIVDIKWKPEQLMSFLAGISLQGHDQQGLVHKITETISRDLNVNMKSLHFDTEEGVFKGTIELYVHNVEDLNNLIMHLNMVKGIKTVKRVQHIDEEAF